MAGSALDVSRAIAIKNPAQRQTAYNQAVAAYNPAPTVNRAVQQPVQTVQQPTPVGTPQQTGPSEEELLNQQIDASYNPAYANLNAVEAQYRQEYPTSQQAIENSYGEVVPQYEAAKTTQLQNVAQNRAKNQQATKNAFGQAQDLYSQLRQGYLTRFGGASSTGEASQEILGRETSRQMGGIQSAAQQSEKELANEEMNVNKYFSNALAQLEKDKQLKLQELKNTFDNAIRTINTQRTTLDSEKAAKRLAALQEIASYARQIQYDSQKNAQMLQDWKAMRDESLAMAKQYGAKSVSMSLPNNMGDLSVTGMSSGRSTAPTGYYQNTGTTSQSALPSVNKSLYGEDDFINS